MLKIIKKAVNKIKYQIYHKKTESKRSPKWAALEKSFKASNPTCAACGGRKDLQVHHILPFHLHPELELSVSNLISLCMGDWDCHLLLGHGNSFQTYNPNVVADAAEMLKDLSKKDQIFKQAKLNRQK